MRCLELLEPFVGEFRSTACFMGTLREIDRHLEPSRVDSEVDVLELWVDEVEGVGESAEQMDLFDQRVLAYEEVLRESAFTFGVASVVIRLDLVLEAQHVF